MEPEGIVTKTGKSIRVEDAASDPRFDGSVFDDNGLITRTMICVPLNTLHEVIGCVQIVNKKDGSLYDAEELKLCERMAALAAWIAAAVITLFFAALVNCFALRPVRNLKLSDVA